MKTNIKLQVTPEQSEKVQEICFEHGVKWSIALNKISHIDKPYLAIEPTKIFYKSTAVDYLSIPSLFQEIDADLFIRTNGTCEENLLEECQFAKYGFEKPEFDCTILTKVNNAYIGYATISSNTIVALSWALNGIAYMGVTHTPRYNLTPINKPWYKTCKFPCLVWDIVADKLEVATHNINDTLYLISNIRDHSEVRLLTNDEIEGLKQ